MKVTGKEDLATILENNYGRMGSILKGQLLLFFYHILLEISFTIKSMAMED